MVVNGKVSTLDKDDLKSVLQNTPVSRLEKAEIMYAAPARYRIRGAMVNVVLKSNIGQKPSWSGEVAAMYEQSRREDIAGRGNLLYTSRRFSADVMYSYGFKHTTFGLDKQSWHTMAGDVHELDLKTEAKGYGGRHNLRLGADYDFGKKNLLSVVYNTQYRYGQDCTKMRGTAHSDKTDDGDRQLHNVAADYQSSFGLSAGMDFLFFSNPSQTFLEKDMQDVSRTLNYDSNQRINRWLFYANQLHSLQGGTEINYGVKYTATHDNSYQFYRMVKQEP